MVAIGLAALVAILAIVVSVFAFALAGGGSGETTTVVTRAAARRRAGGRRPGQGADAGRRQGRRVREVREGRPDAAGRARRRGEEVHRRRLPARHPGRPRPRADRGVELRRQRQGLPRHRREPADRRQPGRQGRRSPSSTAARRRWPSTWPHSIDFHSAEVAPEQELHRRRARQEADDRLRRQAPRRLHVPLRHAAGAHAHERRDDGHDGRQAAQPARRSTRSCG